MIRRAAANVRLAVDRARIRLRRGAGVGPFEKTAAVFGGLDSLPQLPDLLP